MTSRSRSGPHVNIVRLRLARLLRRGQAESLTAAGGRGAVYRDAQETFVNVHGLYIDFNPFTPATPTSDERPTASSLYGKGHSVAIADMSGDEAETPTGPVENAWAIKVPEFKKGDMKSHLLEESSFSVIFPKYREKYLRECWPLLQKSLDEYGIKAELDLIEGRMTVRTTRKTWDPYIIIKARDIIVLLGRSVPVEQAVKILKDDVTYELVKIRNMVRNKDRFVKRRQRLVGANGTTLKALELLTNCYVLVQGATVAAIGPHKGVLQVVRVVKDTMNNIHPVYLLKALMIKRQLMQDPNLKNEDWSRFIPNFTPKNVKRKKPLKVKKTKKEYTPFPPAPTERKVDREMAEGKFFMDQEEKKKAKKRKITEEMKKEAADRQKEKRAKAFVAPEEPKYKPVTPKVNTQVDVEALKKKIKKKKKV